MKDVCQGHARGWTIYFGRENRFFDRCDMRLTTELSDHGQRQQRLEFTPDVHLPWFRSSDFVRLSHIDWSLGH
jgi:hypothetical protein